VLAAFVDLFAQFPVVAPYARDLGAGPALAGAVVAAYSLASLLGNLGAVAVLGRWGPRVPLVVGLLGSALALALYGGVDSAEALLAPRVAHGLSAGLVTPAAFALLGNAAPSGARARAMGSAGALIAVAAVATPPLAGIGRDRLGAAAVFLSVALVLGLAAVLIGVLLRGQGFPPAERRRGDRSSVLRSPALRVACGGALALTVGLGSLVTHLPLLLEARGEGARSSGAAFAAYALVALVAMAGPVPRLADRHGRRCPLGVGLLLIGLALLALAGASSAWGVYAAMGLFGLGFGAVFPAATALAADAGGPAARGPAFGIFYAVYSFGVILGALASGVLGEALGAGTPAPFIVSAACAIVAGIAVLAAPGRRAASPTA
jgi:MFS family permease